MWKDRTPGYLGRYLWQENVIALHDFALILELSRN